MSTRPQLDDDGASSAVEPFSDAIWDEEEDNALVKDEDDVFPEHQVSSQQLETRTIPERPDDSTRQSLGATSHVNGQGLWRSWQRSFRRPLDAMLDLIDNAVDANHGHGRVRISTTTPNANRLDEGILMINSFCSQAYKEMHKILEVFSSQKEQQAIGENGVGIKQASASLADFSIVVTKKGTRFQVGFLCSILQRPEGIHIPSYTIEGDWEEELDLLCESDAVFWDCMEFLGGRRVKESTDYITIEEKAAYRHSGQDRLLELFSHISDYKDWKEHECVFALLLDQMRIQQTSPADVLLNELRLTLPKTYLHIQAHQCEISIGRDLLTFQHWERRLAELTCFPINVSSTYNVFSEHKDYVANPAGSTELRVFVGFDPQRSADPEQTSAATLYIYSRECGRLVKQVPDCRNELGLTAGGTAFCQGLTVILDDFQSSLPLTPTKQDISWSDGKNGDIHRANVNCWLKAVVQTYYTYHLQRFGTKGALNDEVKRQLSAVKSLLQTKDFVTPLSDHTLFNCFTELQWAKHGGFRIIPKNKNAMKVKPGVATLIQFSVPMPVVNEPKPTSKKRALDLEEQKPPPTSIPTNLLAEMQPQRTIVGQQQQQQPIPLQVLSQGQAESMTQNQVQQLMQLQAIQKQQQNQHRQNLLQQQSNIQQQQQQRDHILCLQAQNGHHLLPTPIMSSSFHPPPTDAARIVENFAAAAPQNITSRTVELPKGAKRKHADIVYIDTSPPECERKIEEDKIQQMEDELHAKDKLISKLKQQLDAKNTEVHKLELQLKQSNTTNEELELSKQKMCIKMNHMDSSSAELESLQRRVKLLEAENKAMKEELDKKNEELLALEEQLG